MTDKPTLHLLCGKIAAGKSSLAASLSKQANTIVISQDKWLATLYLDEIKSLSDYVRHVVRLQDALKPHLVDLLRTGVSIVLDFPANTVKSRAWMRSVFEEAGVAHKLHFLDTPDDVCRARLAARNASGEHDYQVSEAQFEEFTRYFEPPNEAEGFDIVIYRP